MKLHYYPETDSLYIELKLEPVADTREMAEGLNIDFDADGEVERDAAKRAFDSFLGAHNCSANQIEFLNIIIEHLTDRGAMDPRLLYESPFTDIDPNGVAGLFSDGEVVELIDILEQLKRRTAA